MYTAVPRGYRDGVAQRKHERAMKKIKLEKKDRAAKKKREQLKKNEERERAQKKKAREREVDGWMAAAGSKRRRKRSTYFDAKRKTTRVSQLKQPVLFVQ